MNKIGCNESVHFYRTLQIRLPRILRSQRRSANKGRVAASEAVAGCPVRAGSDDRHNPFGVRPAAQPQVRFEPILPNAAYKSSGFSAIIAGANPFA